MTDLAFKPDTVLHGERIRLRPFEERDLHGAAECCDFLGSDRVTVSTGLARRGSDRPMDTPGVEGDDAALPDVPAQLVELFLSLAQSLHVRQRDHRRIDLALRQLARYIIVYDPHGVGGHAELLRVVDQNGQWAFRQFELGFARLAPAGDRKYRRHLLTAGCAGKDC